MTIVLFEDKLGITTGYLEHWTDLLQSVGLDPHRVRRVSTWKDPSMSMLTLLTRKGNRKSPGFNPDSQTQELLTRWVISVCESLHPELILCMDTALLGLVEPSWDIATIDNLRGGVYSFFGIPWLVMTPISAIYTQKKPKDIRFLNDGAEDEDEFEESDHDPEEFFMEPYTIPYGRRILAADLKKATRILAQ